MPLYKCKTCGETATIDNSAFHNVENEPPIIYANEIVYICINCRSAEVFEKVNQNK